MTMALPPSPEALVVRRIRADVQAMNAYAVQDPQGMVKLDAMENPYRLSAALQSAMGARLGAVALNRLGHVVRARGQVAARSPKERRQQRRVESQRGEDRPGGDVTHCAASAPGAPGRRGTPPRRA
jgi:hypothetical protein